MAQYTRSAAEQFRPEETSVGWLWNIFIFSVVVFGSVLLLFLGMQFGYEAFLNNELTRLQSEIDVVSSQVSADDQKRLTAFYSQAYNIQKLFNDHTLITKLFTFLEESANTRVFYTNMSFAADSNALNVQGEAESYEVVARQLEALRQRPEVKEVLLTSSGDEARGAGVSFSLRVLLNKSLTKMQ